MPVKKLFSLKIADVLKTVIAEGNPKQRQEVPEELDQHFYVRFELTPRLQRS